MDYYKLLGVALNATPDQIKNAYRQQAKKCHPDLFRQAGPLAQWAAVERFKQLNEANAILSDPKRRARYDALLARRQAQAPPSYRPTESEIRKAKARAAAHARDLWHQAKRREAAERERRRRDSEERIRREQEREQAQTQAQVALTLAPQVALTLLQIPAGEFVMGSNPVIDTLAESAERPQQRVYVPEFFIGRYPVTNTQYAAFVKATGHPAPDHWFRGDILYGREDHPVTGVAWADALAFSQWLGELAHASGRLPTEAEWEKAARSEDGRLYPWGNEWDRWRLNTGEGKRTEQGWDWDTSPVGYFSPEGDSPYGLADMAGNVWEWCLSIYRPYPYQADDGRNALNGHEPRVLRGGALSSPRRVARCAYRRDFLPQNLGANIGFRVVMETGWDTST